MITDTLKDSVLFVTAFKDIGRGSWANYTRSTDTYIEWFMNLSKTPIRLICFCEDDIAKILNEKGFLNTYPYEKDNTFFKVEHIEKSIIESAHFKNIISKRTDDSNSSECINHLYNIVTNNKVLFLDRARAIFPSYSNYAWIDFGYMRDPLKIPQALNFSSLAGNTTIRVPSFNNIDVDKILDPINLLIYPTHYFNPIQGSLFIVPINLVSWLSKEYTSMVVEYYKLNIIDDDQAIILQLYKKFADKFTLHIHNEWFTMLKEFEVEQTLDVVILTCKKDVNTLDQCVTRVRKYIKNLKNIYVICNKSLESSVHNATFIDEEIFPFTIASIKDFIKDKSLNGRIIPWFYQQLLKLYAHIIIPSLNNNHLIVDSETLFYNEYSPFENGKVLYPVTREVSRESRTFIPILLPDIKIKYDDFSGTVHQMLFQTHILQHLFDRVSECFFRRTGQKIPFWKIMLFMATCFTNHIIAFSEYDLYVNFILTFHSNVTKLTADIEWDTVGIIPETSNYTYLTAHAHFRGNEIRSNMYKVDKLIL